MIDPFLHTPEKLAIFVQEYVRHDGQDDAHIIAVTRADLRDPQYHPATIAERLLAKPEIQAAIQAVKSMYRPNATTDVTSDTIMNDMEALYQKCVDERQYTPAISAKKMQAEILGLLKRDINVNVKHSITGMSDAELEKIAKRGAIEGEYTDVTPSTGLAVVQKTINS